MSEYAPNIGITHNSDQELLHVFGFEFSKVTLKLIKKIWDHMMFDHENALGHTFDWGCSVTLQL
jgi:hypothetical protein